MDVRRTSVVKAVCTKSSKYYEGSLLSDTLKNFRHAFGRVIFLILIMDLMCAASPHLEFNRVWGAASLISSPIAFSLLTGILSKS